MRARYLILLTGDCDSLAEGQRVAEATGLRIGWTHASLVAFVNDACSCLPLEGRGVALGTVFPRHGPSRAIREFSDSERTLIERDGVGLLLKNFWGGYVVASAVDGGTEILRDPSGALPCYCGTSAAGRLFASDVDLLLAAGAVVTGFDWDAMGRSLLRAGLPVAETALAGIGVLLPGMGARVQGQAERFRIWWSPWDFVEPNGTSHSETAERLRRVVENCVAGWASCYRRPLLSLSGGLDSSIVAASLAAAGAKAACITMYTDDPAGDERAFARELCAQCDFPLSECRFALEAIDLSVPLGGHLPRPLGRAQDQAYERAHLDVAVREGADAFFTGNGGDNVFGYSQSAAAVADRLLRHGPSVGLMRTFRDVSRQTGAGSLRVAKAALKIALRQHGYRWRTDPLFIHTDFAAANGDGLAHPWLDAPRGALPGKAAQIAALVRVQPNLEPGRSRFAPVVNPLLSQPIVEACLAIQSWEWRAGGRDRALARDAFARDLPASILNRRVKGSPDQFCGAIIRQNRDQIRQRILGGRLAGRGILDLPAVERALLPNHATSGVENVRLLEICNLEAWVNLWDDRLRQ